MFGERHDLHHDFPEFENEIRELKMRNKHFARFFNEYDELSHEMTRIQQGIETPSDDFVESLKKKRLFLKDELYFMILKYKRKENKKAIKAEKKRLKEKHKK
ncbi:YdcH family protein [Marinicella rhabdoformis]|uniref:YdcH family protein n=1 Tax=Marinicella rhabdoformis TaxID=2580566 RepID=UPI0012AEC39A|nr:DUF465 domain-containing protein [Marinicella rhabdoformis]